MADETTEPTGLAEGAVLLLEPGRPARAIDLPDPAVATAGRALSCLMPTRGLLQPALHAIACFQAQHYAARELVITCAEPDSPVERHVRALRDPAIRFVAANGAHSSATLRNRLIPAADGEIVCLWDDDDLYHPDRLGWQMAALQASDAAACFLSRELLWWPARRRIALSPRRIWENSMVAARDGLPRYSEGLVRGADTPHGKALRATVPLVVIDRPEAYCYVAHGANLWGERHFEMLFANATNEAAGEAHDAALARLAPYLPVAAYVAGLSAATSAG